MEHKIIDLRKIQPLRVRRCNARQIPESKGFCGCFQEGLLQLGARGSIAVAVSGKPHEVV